MMKHPRYILLLLAVIASGCDNGTGPDPDTEQPLGLDPERSLAVGGQHACALTNAGRAYCWGSNSFGQLGTGDQVPSGTPVRVATDSVFVEIAAGDRHTCARTAAGAAYCWGHNERGQLGTGDAVSSTGPVAVAAPIEFAALAASGRRSTCGIDTSGTVFCWGLNDGGQLGIGTMTPSLVPVQVSSDETDFRSIAAGLGVCALAGDGVAHCWGFNGTAALGTGDRDSRLVPTAIAGVSFEHVSGPATVNCGIGEDGRTYCWGNNYFGVTGQGTVEDGGSTAPSAIAGDHAFSSVHVGGHNNVFNPACALTPEGRAYCWGANVFGALGTRASLQTCEFVSYGEFPCTGTPTPVEADLRFAVVRPSALFTCGLTTAGEVWCWGDNSHGQLGTPTEGETCGPEDEPCSRVPVQAGEGIEWVDGET